MVGAKNHSLEIKKKIIQEYEKGGTLGGIANQFSISKATVQSIVKKFNDFGLITNLPKSGRKKILTPTDERNLIRKVQANPRLTRKAIVNDFALAGKSVSTSTLKRVLNKTDLRQGVLEILHFTRKGTWKQGRSLPLIIWRSQTPFGRMFFGVMKPKWNCLVTMMLNTSGVKMVRHLILRILSPQSSMVVEISCSGAASHPVGLENLSGFMES